MNIVIMGPQGSGKGTQAELLVKKLGLNYFAAGKILRSIANSGNQYASQVKQTLDSGLLVSDEYVRLIAWDFVNQYDKNQGFIFDGYPRSLGQYEQLQDILRTFGKKIDRVININISQNESIRRLGARRVCEKCGEIYNLVTNPPSGNKCKCGGNLVQREDDKPEAIKKRLEIYHQHTQPVFERAVKEGVGIEINGERLIAVIHEEIMQKLGHA